MMTRQPFKPVSNDHEVRCEPPDRRAAVGLGDFASRERQRLHRFLSGVAHGEERCQRRDKAPSRLRSTLPSPSDVERAPNVARGRHQRHRDATTAVHVASMAQYTAPVGNGEGFVQEARRVGFTELSKALSICPASKNKMIEPWVSMDEVARHLDVAKDLSLDPARTAGSKSRSTMEVQDF
jgi:hypothetical protein